MFGNFMLISGGIVISAVLSKFLERINKPEYAKLVDVALKLSLGIISLSLLNKLFGDITKFL